MNGRVAVLVVIATLLVVGVIEAAGRSPAEVLQGLIRGAFGSDRAWTATLREMTPLLIGGLAVFIALKAGLFNIGVEGQLLTGALAGTVVALAVGGPLGSVFAVLVGVLGGALWAFPAAWIKAYRGGHEVITTIMMNNIALLLTTALIAGPLKAPNTMNNTTADIDASGMMGAAVSVGGLSVSWALVLGLLATFGAAWWLSRTVAGFELRLVGANPTAADPAGVERRRTVMGAMCVSGGVAGLAGSLQVLAFEGRFFEGMSPGYGFDSLGVALLAGPSAAGLGPAAFVFGALAKGTTSIQVLGVPKGIGTVILGLLVVIVGVIRYRREASHG